MCTLTYRVTEDGYELFFNRDEQRSRAAAIEPSLDASLGAIYPVDPVGKGTWIAVHESGLSLALLNFYQAQSGRPSAHFVSRGELILKLLNNPSKILSALKSMQLSCYQPFQLCVFPADLCTTKQQIFCFQWDGEKLNQVEQQLPITSSSVDYEEVYASRKNQFASHTSVSGSTSDELIAFHQSQQSDGKLSVRMSRNDAQTVSFSQIRVADEISFDYIDYANQQRNLTQCPRRR